VEQRLFEGHLDRVELAEALSDGAHHPVDRIPADLLDRADNVRGHMQPLGWDRVEAPDALQPSLTLRSEVTYPRLVGEQDVPHQQPGIW
jgi:hypothetical protein